MSIQISTTPDITTLEVVSMGKMIVRRLLSVKSIVTLTLTGVFSYLAIVGKIGGEQFLTIFTVIISFYFGTQAQKESDDSSAERKSENTPTVTTGWEDESK